MKLKDMPNPMQPIGFDETGKVIRFKGNAIVRHILDCARDGRKCDLNDLAIMDDLFSTDDKQQFAQLIGYSIGGFGELSYVPREKVEEADGIAEAIYNNKKYQDKQRKKKRRKQ